MGTFAEDGFEDGEDAGLLFAGADGLRGAGASGFAADVDEVRAVIEHGERVFECGIGLEKCAAVGK